MAYRIRSGVFIIDNGEWDIRCYAAQKSDCILKMDLRTYRIYLMLG